MTSSYTGVLVILVGLLAGGCQGEPPVPVHRVGSAELPVLDMDGAKGVDADDFQLVQLKDGHDYWFYRDTSVDRGFGALAHSPECQKCRRSDERDIVTSERDAPSGVRDGVGDRD